MGELSRIGVSIDSELLHRFDSFIADQGYDNRSEAFRDLIRDRLVGSVVVAANALVVGTVTLIYDHHTRLLPEKLTDLQHESHDIVISTLHAHLDHESCLEVVVLRGKVERRTKAGGSTHQHKRRAARASRYEFSRDPVTPSPSAPLTQLPGKPIAYARKVLQSPKASNRPVIGV
jgi:CopG family nickel-responsive transcriptional regulator